MPSGLLDGQQDACETLLGHPHERDVAGEAGEGIRSHRPAFVEDQTRVARLVR